MPELIDRHALKNHLYRAQAEAFILSEWYVGGAIQSFIDILDKQPTIEPKRGEWVETEPDEDDRKLGIEFSIKCSICHDENSHLDFNENHEIIGKTFWKSRFCPNCGADMRG